ncbi:MAG: hypothetical protein ACLUD0_05565 [Eubacterium ramulus]
MKKDNVLAKNAKSNFGMTHWLVILLMMGFGYFSNGSMNDGLNTYVGLFVDKPDGPRQICLPIPLLLGGCRLSLL